MIRITLQVADDGTIRRFTAKGHAGYAEQGSDIICAAVTALASTCIGSLTDLVRISPVYVLEEGRIDIRLPDPSRMSPGQHGQADLLMQSLVLGCRQILVSYGDRYLQIRHAASKGGTQP